MAALMILLISTLTGIMGGGCSRSDLGETPGAPLSAETQGGGPEDSAQSSRAGRDLSSQVVSPGRESTISAGNIEIWLPVGSVLTETAISLRVIDPERGRFVLEPEGLVLAEPAIVTIHRTDQETVWADRAAALHQRSGPSWCALPGNATGGRLQALITELGEFILQGQGTSQVSGRETRSGGISGV